MKLDNQLWRQRVIFGRWLSLILIAAGLLAAMLAYRNGSTALVAINCSLVGANGIIALVNWFWFEL